MIQRFVKVIEPAMNKKQHALRILRLWLVECFSEWPNEIAPAITGRRLLPIQREQYAAFVNANDVVLRLDAGRRVVSNHGGTTTEKEEYCCQPDNRRDER